MLSVMRASAGCDMSTHTRPWLVEAARSLVAGQLWNSCVWTSSFTLILIFLSIFVSLASFFHERPAADADDGEIVLGTVLPAFRHLNASCNIGNFRIHRSSFGVGSFRLKHIFNPALEIGRDAKHHLTTRLY